MDIIMLPSTKRKISVILEYAKKYIKGNLKLKKIVPEHSKIFNGRVRTRSTIYITTAAINTMTKRIGHKYIINKDKSYYVNVLVGHELAHILCDKNTRFINICKMTKKIH